MTTTEWGVRWQLDHETFVSPAWTEQGAYRMAQRAAGPQWRPRVVEVVSREVGEWSAVGEGETK